MRGIRRLPAGHMLEVSRDGLKITPHWQLDRAFAGTRRMSHEDAGQEMRRLVDEAVRCRLPPDAEIGAHLSGGLDSSSIAVLAARQLAGQGRTLHAYSMLDRRRNDVTVEDETAFVEAVLQQEAGIDWAPVRPGARLDLGPGRWADAIVPQSAAETEQAICADAGRKGVGILLSGWGGDECATFNGRGTLAEHFIGGRWATLAREVRALERERGWPPVQVLKSEVLRRLLPEAARTAASRIQGHAPSLLQVMAGVLRAPVRASLAAVEMSIDGAPDARQVRWQLMTSPHIAARAETWARFGAEHGLAFAFPLLDRRVVEFALSLPSSHFMHGGFRRRMYRDAMAGVLPDKVRNRHEKYRPFPSRVLDIAESKADLLDEVDRLASSRAVQSVFDVAAMRRLVADLPDADEVRASLAGNDLPDKAERLVAATQALCAAAFLARHTEQRPANQFAESRL